MRHLHLFLIKQLITLGNIVDMQINSISSSSAAVSESRISQIEKQIQTLEKQIQQVSQDKTMDAKTKQEMLALYEEQIQRFNSLRWN